MNYFIQLNAINVGEHIEKKNGLSYLSWAWAWAELKKKFPDSFYTIYENEQGWNYHTDGRTAWVKTGVTVVNDAGSTEHIEYLPVMDYKNKSIPLDKVTSFDVNKSIQRSLTKAVARHGLGLYIYAGEDLPEDPKVVALKQEVSDALNCEVEEMTLDDKQQIVKKLCTLKGKEVSKMCAWAGVDKLEELTEEMCDKLVEILNK